MSCIFDASFKNVMNEQRPRLLRISISIRNTYGTWLDNKYHTMKILRSIEVVGTSFFFLLSRGNGLKFLTFETLSSSDKSSCVIIFIQEFHSLRSRIKGKNSVARVGCQKLLYCRLSIPEQVNYMYQQWKGVTLKLSRFLLASFYSNESFEQTV